MNPTKQNLEGLIGKNFKLAHQLQLPGGGAEGVRDVGMGCQLTVSGDTVSLESSDSKADAGLWVPYITARASVGHTGGAGTWVASGPFSGCEFAVGRGSINGEIFGAHVARESGSTGPADFKAYVEKNALSPWYWNKIPMPDTDSVTGACSYIFATCLANGLQSLVRLDVQVTAMGGSDGRISGIKVFK